MHHGADTLKGVATMSAAGGAFAWLTYPNVLSFLCFISGLAAAGWVWYLMRKSELAEHNRHQRIEDGMVNVQLNQIELARMVERLLPGFVPMVQSKRDGG